MPELTATLEKLHALWRASNYLGAAMIYLRDNPLLREPLQPEHIKQRLLGHWGSSPGLAFCYLHLSRIVKAQDLNAIFLAGLEPRFVAPDAVPRTAHYLTAGGLALSDDPRDLGVRAIEDVAQ